MLKSSPFYSLESFFSALCDIHCSSWLIEKCLPLHRLDLTLASVLDCNLSRLLRILNDATFSISEVVRRDVFAYTVHTRQTCISGKTVSGGLGWACLILVAYLGNDTDIQQALDCPKENPSAFV
ncbi:hypothetical protein SISSUDRAFT_1056565 [Sistotremastrum suecicum HHB10207 ss-3]|uniref:Uncharacterized protein n=1 Tax=Sistotremastrum suecicum HHB10207 ss-3 TaxID=1314776 RepID=A0A165WLF0_9AGAM|nr:hypothetical protein SISSUDRAFT_1056565 [Sistotremastrum suecicum HHB10207 ss-3]